MKPHESPRINKKSIRGNSGDSWPVWNRGIKDIQLTSRSESVFGHRNFPRRERGSNLGPLAPEASA